MARPKREAPWLERREDNGAFYAHWYDDVARKTQRLSLRTTDPDEAQDRFAEFLLTGKDIRRPKGGLTVGLMLDDYYKEHVLVHCADTDRQEDAINNLKAFFGIERAATDIDVPLSQGYANARYKGEVGGGKRRKNKTASPTTVRRELNVLVSAANHAIWMGRHKGEIQVDLPPERRLGEDDEAPYYSEEERDAIFAAAEEMTDDVPDMPHFVKLLYYTGARRRSIEDLDRTQVRLPQKRIVLQKPGKKLTKKRQPIVPILNVMEPIVVDLLAIGGSRRLFARSEYYRPYIELCEKVGIDADRRHPHIMRHTRATHLLQNGKTIYDVAKLLGDTVSTVERVYGHHSHDHLAARLED